MNVEIPNPPSTVRVGFWLFLRGLALAYFFAFASAVPQLPGLIGERGILPAKAFLAFLQQQLGGQAFFAVPSLFWIDAGDAMLRAVPILGAVLSLLVFLDVAPALLLLVLWFLYLSIVTIGQDFFAFQWDGLLLETGLLAVLAAPWRLRPRFFALSQPSFFPLFLLRFLLFRLMFLSGLVKLASGDPSWHDLTALTYHYFTQPLPSPLSWFIALAPLWFHQACAFLLFVIELVLVWGAFGPALPRRIAAGGVISLQLVIALTGNYAFFNWLTVALALLLVDDACFMALSGRLRSALARPYKPVPLSPLRKALVYGAGGFLLFWSCVVTVERLDFGDLVPAFVEQGDQAVAAWRSVNSYGLFAVMTKTRNEILIQGSDDHVVWKPYLFPDKPGNVRRLPRWVAPYQPRLDWQMWFAALSTGDKTFWFQNLMVRLLQGSPEVLSLFEKNPFPDHPPKYVRALLFDYRFTTWNERKTTGAWWKTAEEGWYYPTLTLKPSPH